MSNGAKLISDNAKSSKKKPDSRMQTSFDQQQHQHQQALLYHQQMAILMQQKTPELQQQNALVANGISDITSSASTSVPIASQSQIPPLSDASPLKFQTNQIYHKNLNISNMTTTSPILFAERPLASPKIISRQVNDSSRDLSQSRHLELPNIQESETPRNQNGPDILNEVTRKSAIVAGGKQALHALPSDSKSVLLKKRQTTNHTINQLMTADVAKPLIASLKIDEKLIYIARHAIGGLNENGFQRATSNVEKLKKKLLRNGAIKKGKNKQKISLSENTDDNSTQSSSQSLLPNNDDCRLALKSNPDVVKGMIIEMGLGVTYCESLMTTIKSLLVTLGSNGVSKGEVKSSNLGHKKNQSYREKRKHTTKVEDFTGMKVGNGKRRKMKEEMAYSRSEMSRFRTLFSGDYVVARAQTKEPLFLARVVAHWEGLNCSPYELLQMSWVSVSF